MKIKFLKAHNGDCFLISLKDDGGTNRNVLIDGGMSGTYYNQSNNRFGQLKTEIDSIRGNGELIDLLILTHIDNDHIMGFLKWFEMDKRAHELVKNVWFNSGKLIAEYLKEPENSDLALGLQIFNSPETGVHDAIDFENYLLNKKILERKIVTKGNVVEDFGVKIEVLSPDITQLKRLVREYKKKTGDIAYTGGGKNEWEKDIETLIKDEKSDDFEFKQDRSVKNGSSISFVITIEGKSFLFLGDAHPKGLVQTLKEMGYTKESPLEVEFLKVSHHGSKGNTNTELLTLVQTDKYLISTNSSGHGHPDKRTLARILQTNPNAIIYFNYKNVRDSVFTNKDRVDFKIRSRVKSEFEF